MVLCRSISFLLFSVLFLVVGNGLMGTLVGLGVPPMNLGGFSSGIVLSCFFIGLTLGAYKAGNLISLYGHVRSFCVFATVYSAATLLHPVFHDPVTWGILRVIEGFCAAGLYMILESWLNEKADSKNRGYIFSLYMMTIHISLGFSQAFILLSDVNGFNLFVLASVCLSFSIIPICLNKSQKPTVPEQAFYGIKKLFTTSPVAFIGIFAVGILIGNIYGYLPVFFSQSGYSKEDISFLMIAALLGGLFVQIPIGNLSDKKDRRIALSVAFMGLSIALGAFFFIDNFILRLVFIGLFGGFTFSIYPVCLSHMSDWVSPENMVGISGGLLLVSSIGSSLGPILCSYFFDLFGLESFFVINCAIGITVSIFSFGRIFVRKPKTKH